VGTVVSARTPELFPLDIRGTPLHLGASGPDAYAALLGRVIPGFPDHVSFVLAEILELERVLSRAHLFLYSGCDEAAAKQLLKDYFEVIEQLVQAHGWSLSSLDNLYFDPVIWCGRLPGAPSSQLDTAGRLGWQHLEWELRRDYNRGEWATVGDIETAFLQYLRGLQSLSCFQNTSDTYVLLIPIALNSPSALPTSRFKVGAVFLHFATSVPVTKADLLTAYRAIVEYWHYWFTSEALGKRVTDLVAAESLIDRGELMERISDDLKQVQEHANSIRGPATRIMAELAPSQILTKTGGSLRQYFKERRPNVLNGSVNVVGFHKWSDGDLVAYRDLCAAVIITLLSIDDEARHPLWEFVRSKMDEPPPRLRRVFEVLGKYMPELGQDALSKEDLRRLFMRLKHWFDTALKPTKALHAEYGMPVALACATLELSAIRVACRLEDVSVRVLSRHPADTAAALDVLARSQQCLGVEVLQVSGRVMWTFTRVARELGRDSLARIIASAGTNDGSQGEMGGAIAQLFGGRTCKLVESDGEVGVHCEHDDGRQVSLAVPDDTTLVVTFDVLKAIGQGA
jgi:hypothetical protein